jgi:lipid-binding SYLF domain-containing protein
MLKRQIAILGITLLALSFSPAWAADTCPDTIALFKKAGESANFFKTAYGYAVFPTIGKGGVGIGGAYGKGCVYAKGKHVGDTSMAQVSIGFQLGGQGFSEIIFFQDERAFKEFTGGNFEFGADATAVAITLAAGASAKSTGASAGASRDQA